MTAAARLTFPAGDRGRLTLSPGRRAVIRWAWRLFRREWRQQLLVLGLIAVAVAATILGAAVATNTPVPAAASFGTARDLATFSDGGPRTAAGISLIRQRFGTVDVIEDQTLPVPGAVATYQLRAQNPEGAYGRPLLRLASGRYPAGAGQVALTDGLATALGLRVGSVWRQGSVTRRVVGIVEDPENLLDSFALVAPGQVTAPTRVTVLFDAAPGRIPAALAANVQLRSDAGQTNVFNPQNISLAGLTMGMVLIALVAVGGFTVLAQRRLRSLGMLASLGATERDVGLVVRANGAVVGGVGALVGLVGGVGAWLIYRPHLESSAHHSIGTWALPWPVTGAAVALAVVAAYLAASRPARSVVRIPVVAALSGRPAPPRPVSHSALPGLAFLAAAFLLLGWSGSQEHFGGSGGMPELVLGLLALVPAVVLLSPFCLSLLARAGRRAPISARLALRDLDRFRARSGSALAAISIGVLIAVLITIVAAARYSNALDYVGPNLAPNQLVVYTPNGPGFRAPDRGPSRPTTVAAQPALGSLPPPPPAPTTPTAAQVAAMGRAARAMSTLLGARQPVELDITSATLRHAAQGRNWSGPLYVATPALLRSFGFDPSRIPPAVDILTRRPGISGLSGMQLLYDTSPGPEGFSRRNPTVDRFPCPAGMCVAGPVVQESGALPAGTAAPNTVITEAAVSRLGLQSQTAGWLIQAPGALTASQIDGARRAAAAAGMSIETRNDEPTSDQITNTATVFGIGLALAILAMSIGLIRSETAGDLRTLAATGAGSRTRRAVTAATAGGLGLLGALLGTTAGYVGVIGWIRTNSLNGGISALGNVPVANLLAILVGLPVVATAVGWLLAGREPPALAHQPLE